MVAPFITLVRARKLPCDRIKANWIFLIRNPRKREVYLIVGALLGSTSISVQPHNFARYWLHLTNTNSFPKKDFKTRIKTNYKHWLFNVFKSEPKKLTTARPHARCYWHDYPRFHKRYLFTCASSLPRVESQQKLVAVDLRLSAKSTSWGAWQTRVHVPRNTLWSTIEQQGIKQAGMRREAPKTRAPESGKHVAVIDFIEMDINLKPA